MTFYTSGCGCHSTITRQVVITVEKCGILLHCVRKAYVTGYCVSEACVGIKAGKANSQV